MGEELKAWVADALHAVAGFSSSSVASYVASLPSRASSRDQLAALLREADINDSNFCDELWQRARGSAGAQTSTQQPRRRRQPLPSSNEDDTTSRIEQLREKQKRRTQRTQQVVDPEAQRKDNALDEDLEERDALVQRMRERDEQRTKRLEAEQGLSQQEIAELATRGTVDPLAREDDVKLMRKFARQAYLDKWEAKQLVLTQRLFPKFKLRRRRRRDAASRRWRLHDHMRVHASRECTETVSRRRPCHTGPRT